MVIASMLHIQTIVPYTVPYAVPPRGCVAPSVIPPQCRLSVRLIASVRRFLATVLTLDCGQKEELQQDSRADMDNAGKYCHGW